MKEQLEALCSQYPDEEVDSALQSVLRGLRQKYMPIVADLVQEGYTNLRLISAEALEDGWSMEDYYACRNSKDLDFPVDVAYAVKAYEAFKLAHSTAKKWDIPFHMPFYGSVEDILRHAGRPFDSREWLPSSC